MGLATNIDCQDEGSCARSGTRIPDWLTSFPGDWEENADATNAWIYQKFHDQLWAETYDNWKAGFQHLLDLSEKVPERNLLALGQYGWLQGHSLAVVLVASYDHHQEHWEKLDLKSGK